MKPGVVIVGAGHGGVQAAASLREEGYEGPVIIIGDENELPYHKPPLSKTFLKDPEAAPQILRAQGFYDAARIELRLGTGALRIDASAGRLDLAAGDSIAFDRLIIATGARPRLPSLPGATHEGVLSLRSLADARAIRDLSASAEDVVIIGGGFIGLEAAATLAAEGRRVTVVEAQDRLLGRAVAPAISAHVRHRLTACGVRILTETTLERLDGAAGRVVAAVTGNGDRIAAAMVVVGIGVVPNVELAEAAGLATGNGIRVDEQLRTSRAGILAIGDCANYRHWSTGADTRLESVQNATDQARLAARTITGHADSYAAVPWFWSDIGDMKLQMVGLAAGSDTVMATGEPGDNRFSLFHYRDGRLAAIESVNRPADHMLGRRMLAAGYSPDPRTVAKGGLKEAFARWQEAREAVA